MVLYQQKRSAASSFCLDNGRQICYAKSRRALRQAVWPDGFRLFLNNHSENRHRPGWRFSSLIRIVITFPRIWSVIVSGTMDNMGITSFRRCGQTACRCAAHFCTDSIAYAAEYCQVRTRKEALFLSRLFCYNTEYQQTHPDTLFPKEAPSCPTPFAPPSPG